MKRSVLTMLLVLGSALLVLPACAKDFVLSSPPLEGRVIERETHRPVPDALVVVLWKGTVGWSGTVCFHVATASTDADGTYRLPAWRKPSPYGDIQGRHHLPLAYKPGYEEAGGNQDNVYLQPFSGSREERLKVLQRSAVSCHQAGESKENLLPLAKALYEEALGLAETEDEKKIVNNLLFSLEIIELGYEAAERRDIERRRGQK